MFVGSKRHLSTIMSSSPANFKPRKVLVLNKVSRYEFEKNRNLDKTEMELKLELKQRGSDYDDLLYHHNLHVKCSETIIKSLTQHGMDIRVVNRSVYIT